MEENNQLPPQQDVNVKIPLQPSDTTIATAKKTGRFSLKAIISTIIFLLLAGGAAAGYVYREPILKLVSNTTTIPTPAIVQTSPTPTPDPTADWKIYEGNGFSFKYPNIMSLEEESNYSTLIDKSPEMVGQPREIFVRKLNSSLSNYATNSAQSFGKYTFRVESKDKDAQTRLGGKEVQEYIISCGVHCYWRIIQFSSNNTNHELFFDIAGGGLIQFSDQILSTFKFTEKHPQPTSCKEVKTGITEIVDGPFREISKNSFAGEVDVEGEVVSRIKQDLSGQVEMVYVVLANKNGSTAYGSFLEYYTKEAASGNTINYIENGTLIFRLGAINNNKFETQSAVDTGTVEKIKEALNTNQRVKLHLKIPIYGGSGAASDFSYACEYRLNP